MPHTIRSPGAVRGTALAVFLAFVHVVNDAVTAILGALVPTLQQRFDATPSLMAMMVATYWIASSVTQPLFGALAEDLGPRRVGALGVVFAAIFLSLIGVAGAVVVVFALLVIGGMGSAALHPVGSAIAGGPTVRNRTLGVGFFTAGGMIGFALGPVLILYLLSRYGSGVTPWFMVPGLILGGLVYLLLPDYEPHGLRRLRDLFDLELVRGPVGVLVLGGSLVSVTFLTFISSVPLWLVQEHGYPEDGRIIGWTLAAFSTGAGVGSLLGGLLAPRLGRRAIVVGSLVLAAAPLAAIRIVDVGGVVYFVAAFAAGVLLYAGSPVSVVIAQDLAPHAPAAAAGMVLGLTTGIAGALYIALGWLQDQVGLATGMSIGFAMVVPAALLAFTVFVRRPDVAR